MTDFNMNNIKKYEHELFCERYYKINHHSGLEVYVFPKEMSGYYAIISASFGGAVSEYLCDGEKVVLPQGCAHFLEHKLFDNEDGRGADDVFSSCGAYDGAYTSSEKTAFLFSCTDNFDECLSELLTFVTHPYFTDASVKKEIGIIAEEIRGCEDDPYDRCYMNMLDGMYFNNNVKNEICGTEESISQITPEILYRCCEDFYRPENMILAVCGNVTPQRVLEITDRCIFKSDIMKRISVPVFFEPAGVRRGLVERKMPVGKPIFCLGIKDINIPSDPVLRLKKNEAANILCGMLFSASEQFYLDMIDRGLLSPGFDCGYSINKNTAYVMMSGESDEPKALRKEITDYIERCRRSELDKKAFEREKRVAYAAYVSDFDSVEDIAFSLLSFAENRVDMFEYAKILESIEFEDVKRVFDEIFDTDNITLSVVMPIDDDANKD